MTNIREYVEVLLNSYSNLNREVSLLRHELEHPVFLSPSEEIEAMTFARGEEARASSGHIGNKTLYIALNYQNETARINQEKLSDLSKALIPAETKLNRLDCCINQLPALEAEIIRLHYGQLKGWHDVAENLAANERTIQRHHRKAVQLLTEMYEILAKAGVLLK